MAYTKRKDGRYQTSITINGKKKYIIANTSNELDKKITELKYLGNKGISLNDDDITLGNFADKWFEINSIGKEDATIKQYKLTINNYIKPKIGYKKLKNLKVYDIQQCVNELVQQGHIRTARLFLLYIKKILKEAVDNDLILKNVASSIKPPKYTPKGKEILTEEEDRLLIKCSKEHKYGLFFLLIRYTGIRKEEVAAIEIKDIDFNNNTIHINKAISYATTNKGKIKNTKNNKDRYVYILDIFKEQLQEKVKYCKENSIQYLFTKQTNKKEKLSDSSIKKMLQSFLLYMNKNSEKEIKFSLHQLRHSFCTMLYYAGIGIKEAQELMGHSSADMVYDIYTHLDMDKGKPFEKLNETSKKLM